MEASTSVLDASCPLDPLNVVNQIIGWGLVVGSSLSYIPQVLAFVRAKSSWGVSHWYQGITVLTGFLLLSVPVLVDAWKMTCCRQWSANECSQALLPMLQYSNTFLGQLVTFGFFLYYWKPDAASVDHDVGGARRQLRVMLGGLALVFVVTLVTGSAILGSEGVRSARLVQFSDALAVGGIVSGAVIYLPQIRQTYLCKSSGALSLITLVIQTGGLAVFIYFQLVADAADVQIYLSQVLQLILSSVLCSMCIYYDFVKTGKLRALLAACKARFGRGGLSQSDSAFLQMDDVWNTADDHLDLDFTDDDDEDDDGEQGASASKLNYDTSGLSAALEVTAEDL